jgi:hypothetical protein
MAKKKVSRSVKSSKKPLHHHVAQHLEKPVGSLLSYTIILMFLVATLVILATYMQ